MDLNERQCQFTEALALLILKARDLGLRVRFAEVTRSVEQQREYVATGRSKTMDSRHLDKLAADLVIYKDGVPHSEGEIFRPLGQYWESVGGRWGGRFGLEQLPKPEQDAQLGWDSDHFEFRKI